MPGTFDHTNPARPVSLNDRMAIYWPIDRKFYPGAVCNLNNHDATITVYYDHGQAENLLLNEEIWKYDVNIDSPADPINPARQMASGSPISTTPIPTNQSREASQVISGQTPPIMGMSNHRNPRVQEALQLIRPTFLVQLDTLDMRVSNMRKMLFNRSTLASDIKDRFETLRSDVDNLEVEVTSRVDMQNMLDATFVEQEEDLHRSHAAIIENMKAKLKEMKELLIGEMKAVQQQFTEEIRNTNAEEHHEVFHRAAERIMNTSVRNASEDISFPSYLGNNT